MRALLSIAANPVISNPNSKRLDNAPAGLGFYGLHRLHLNETTRHAHVILPPAFR
ncbi:MAG: hypothetical protein R2860_06580 [Desulfobacterales bacterium]